jgi:YHS domain-containing protein
MKNKTAIVIAACSVFFIKCNNKAPGENSITKPVKAEMPQPKKDTVLFAGVKFDSKWDLSCGMPISAGLEDTVHYKGKIYGFCSISCKEDFLKDPVAAIKSKK